MKRAWPIIWPVTKYFSLWLLAMGILISTRLLGWRATWWSTAAVLVIVVVATFLASYLIRRLELWLIMPRWPR